MCVFRRAMRLKMFFYRMLRVMMFRELYNLRFLRVLACIGSVNVRIFVGSF